MQKKWYQSKTLLSAVALFLVSLYEIYSGDTGTGLKVLEAIAGLGVIYGLRDALG